MLTAIFGGIFNFVKEFVKTLIIDTLVGFCLKPIGF